MEGRVVGVSDGDTLTVLDAARNQFKIRLAAIDAPEKRQPFGNRSKQNLSFLVFNKLVKVNWTKHDRYGRIVGKVLVTSSAPCGAQKTDCPNYVDVGLVPVAAGMAWHYKKYASEQPSEDRNAYAISEGDARAKGLGLWQDRNPVPPWEWRQQRR